VNKTPCKFNCAGLEHLLQELVHCLEAGSRGSRVLLAVQCLVPLMPARQFIVTVAGGTDAVALWVGPKSRPGSDFRPHRRQLDRRDCTPRVSILDSRPSPSFLYALPSPALFALSPNTNLPSIASIFAVTYPTVGPSHRVDIAVSAPLDPTTKRTVFARPHDTIALAWHKHQTEHYLLRAR
jgi:hypothetical protein